MPDKKLTIDDIARMAKVSQASVSRVLNSLPGVRPSSRERIIRIIKETGYEPSTLAAGLSRGKIKIIGLILADIRNPFYADVAFNVQKSLRKYGYSAMVFSSEYDSTLELEYLALSDRLKFSGVIMISALNTAELNQSLSKLSCPVVLLNRTIENFNGSTVITNNFQAGYRVTEHLINLGHQSIAFIIGPMNSSASYNRLLGYKQAMADHSLLVNEEFIFQGDLTQNSGFEIGRHALNNFKKFPKAIICGNDLMAIGFMDACQIQHLEVPRDISIVGFDDISASRLQTINLTTIRQPNEKMATNAVDLIINKINDSDFENQHIVLEPELIIRKSTTNYHA